MFGKKVAILALLLISVSSWDLLNAYSSSDLGANETAMDFYRDGSASLIGTSSGTLASYSTTSPYSKINTVTLTGSVTDVKVNPKQDIAAVCTSSRFYIVTIPSLSVQANSTFPTGKACKDLQWSPDGSKLIAVGSVASGVATDYYTFKDFNNLSAYSTIATEFADGSGLTDAEISPNGNLLVLSGPLYDSNQTTSALQLYNLNTGALIESLDVPSNIKSSTRRIQFSPNGNIIAVFAVGTRYLKTYTQNTNGNYVLDKQLVFPSEILAGQFSANSVFAVARNNGSGSVVEFVSLTDSTGSNIVTNQVVSIDKASPNALHFSNDFKYMSVGFGSNGANIYSTTQDKSSYTAVIAAVVGSVVVGSVAAVTVASTVAGAAGGQAAGLIGTAPVGQATTGMFNAGGGMLQKGLF